MCKKKEEVKIGGSDKRKKKIGDGGDRSREGKKEGREKRVRVLTR